MGKPPVTRGFVLNSETVASNSSIRGLSFDLVEGEIRRHNFGVLGTISADGRPHSTGVLYGVGLRQSVFVLYITTNRRNKKARNIARNSSVSFTIPMMRRVLKFLPPHCVQFQGTGEIIPFDNRDARNAFASSLVLRKTLQLEGKHVGRHAVFIRISPDPVMYTYGLGLSLIGLLRNIGEASGRVEIPASRLQT